MEGQCNDGGPHQQTLGEAVHLAEDSHINGDKVCSGKHCRCTPTQQRWYTSCWTHYNSSPKNATMRLCTAAPSPTASRMQESSDDFHSCLKSLDEKVYVYSLGPVVQGGIFRMKLGTRNNKLFSCLIADSYTLKNTLMSAEHMRLPRSDLTSKGTVCQGQGHLVT